MYWERNFMVESNINYLFTNPEKEVTLEVLFDNEDLLQECKGENKDLIDFLIKPEIISEIVELIITEPSQDIEECIRYRKSNLACELLTSNVDRITDALTNNEKYLDKLYGFLQQNCGEEESTTCELNPLLASFFTKTMTLFLCRKPELMINYFKSKEDFIPLLISHIGTAAIMDYWVKLVTCTEDNDCRQQILNWLAEQNVISRIVDVIRPSSTDDQYCNASQALCDIIRTSREIQSQFQETAIPDPLLESIQSSEMVERLLKNILSDEKQDGVIVSGICVIVALLEFKKPNKLSVVIVQDSTHTGNQIVDPNALTPLDIERMENAVTQTLSAVRDNLQDLHQILVDPPKLEPIVTTAGILDPPLGTIRLHVIKLIVALVRANDYAINIQLEKLGTVQVLLDLFFNYSYNNFLHSQVEQCVDVILANEPCRPENSDCLLKNVLLDQLFERCNIVQKVVESWQENCGVGVQRKGYMGHLTLIANHITYNVENCTNSDTINTHIDNLPEGYSEKWEEFVDGTLKEVNKINTIIPVKILEKPLVANDGGSTSYIEMAFPNDSTAAIQQIKQMTSNFSGQFGFNEAELADHDGNSIHSLNFNSEDLNRAMNSFCMSTEDNSGADVFEEICQRKLQTFKDDNSSDDEIWDDKDQDITFTSQTVRKRTNSSNSSDSSDSADELAELADRPPCHVAKEAKMEIDPPFDPFGIGFDSFGATRTPVTSFENMWGSELWTPTFHTETSNISSSTSVVEVLQTSTITVMETSEDKSGVTTSSADVQAETSNEQFTSDSIKSTTEVNQTNLDESSSSISVSDSKNETGTIETSIELPTQNGPA